MAWKSWTLSTNLSLLQHTIARVSIAVEDVAMTTTTSVTANCVSTVLGTDIITNCTLILIYNK